MFFKFTVAVEMKRYGYFITVSFIDLTVIFNVLESDNPANGSRRQIGDVADIAFEVSLLFTEPDSYI